MPTKIINSPQAQRSTSFAQPLGNSRHLLRPRWLFDLVVGGFATDRGYRSSLFAPSFGSLNPVLWAGETIVALAANNDVMVVQFTSDPGVQVSKVNTLRVSLSGFPVFNLPWVGAQNNYTATIAGIGQFMTDNVGNNIGVRLARVD